MKVTMKKGIIGALAVAVAFGVLFVSINSTAGASKDSPEGEGVTYPYLSNIDTYYGIISNLSEDQYYAFAAINKDYDALLVTDGVYEYDDDTLAAIDATVYGLDGNGCVAELGTVSSDGTAYPLSVYEDTLIYGGNHHVAMVYVDNGSITTKKDFHESFDTKGIASYYFFDLDARFEEEVEDDSELVKLYDAYRQAIPINFTKAGEVDILGDEGAGAYPANEFEDRVGKSVFESYDEIIGLLEGEDAYAYVDVKGYDGKVLLVATYTYDDLLGHFATIECTPYTMKPNGTCTADSVITSGGTATPVAIDNQGVLYGVTHHSVDKYCYGENGTDTPAIMALASVYADEFEDNGTPKTVGGFVRTNNSVINDDSVNVEKDDLAIFDELYSNYWDATVINFTRVNESK